MTSQFRCAKHSASCFAVCRTCWKVHALSFCLVLRCLSDALEGSSFIAVWSVSYFVMLLKNFVGVNYQSLRKVCATSGPCTSTRSCFILNGSPCLIELTRCGRKSNQPSAESEVRGRVDLVPAATEKVSLIRSNSEQKNPLFRQPINLWLAH